MSEEIRQLPTSSSLLLSSFTAPSAMLPAHHRRLSVSYLRPVLSYCCRN
jgi:hypothetical protein